MTATDTAAVATPAPRSPWKRRKHISSFLDQALAEVELHNEYPDMAGLSTGLAGLNDAARAVLTPGRLIVVAGFSGGTKTAFLSQLTIAFACQVPTFLITLEDDGVDVAKRQLAQTAIENMGAIRSGFPGRDIPPTLLSAALALSDLPLDMNEPLGSPSVEDLCMYALDWWRDTRDAPTRVLLIDQLSHISDSDPDAPFWARVGSKFERPPARGTSETKVYEWKVNVLRQLAIHLNATIVLAHQLTDKNSGHKEDVRPTKYDLRGSQGITAKADGIIVPWVPKRIPNPDPFAAKDEKIIDNVDKHGFILGLKGRVMPEFEVPVQWVGGNQMYVERGKLPVPAWATVKPISERGFEGMRKLQELRAGFDGVARAASASAADLVAAALVVPVPALPAARPVVPDASSDADILDAEIVEDGPPLSAYEADFL